METTARVLTRSSRDGRFLDNITTFHTKYTPSRCVKVYEQMVAYQGQISIKQHSLTKSSEWGTKSYVLCESESDCVCVAGSCTTARTLSMWRLATLARVHKLFATLHKICSLATKPTRITTTRRRFSKLKDKGQGAVDTVRANRQSLPDQMKHTTCYPICRHHSSGSPQCWHTTPR